MLQVSVGSDTHGCASSKRVFSRGIATCVRTSVHRVEEEPSIATAWCKSDNQLCARLPTAPQASGTEFESQSRRFLSSSFDPAVLLGLNNTPKLNTVTLYDWNQFDRESDC